jgi:hypothetical protein
MVMHNKKCDYSIIFNNCKAKDEAESSGYSLTTKLYLSLACNGSFFLRKISPIFL